jgi:hypothetical protein
MSKRRAQDVLDVLLKLKMISQCEFQHDKKMVCYETTILGNALGMAKAGRPVKRASAGTVLRALLDRVKAVNDRQDLAYRVDATWERHSQPWNPLVIGRLVGKVRFARHPTGVDAIDQGASNLSLHIQVHRLAILTNEIGTYVFQHQCRDLVGDFLKKPMGSSFELFKTVWPGHVSCCLGCCGFAKRKIV